MKYVCSCLVSMLPDCLVIKTVITGTVYLSTPTTTIFESLMQHLEIVYSFPYDIILTGDFNIDLGQSKINTIETVLNVKQLIKSSTCVTDTSSTTIDHIFTTSPEMLCNSGILPITFSKSLLHLHHFRPKISSSQILSSVEIIISSLHPVSYSFCS